MRDEQRMDAMVAEYRSPDWTDYRMDWMGDPHPVMEPLSREIAEIDNALRALVDAGILPHMRYDRERMLDHRKTVKERFEIPWTGISPRMQRLLYAINAVVQPRVMVATGVFCGNTFISNAGAAIGPGACYRAERLVGIEIVPEEARRAKRNVSAVDEEGQAEILAADAVEWIRGYRGTIDLLYIDANGSYLPIAQAAAETALQPGSLVLAHNSVSAASALASYLRYVRDPDHSSASVNMIIDDQGLEVTLWR
jgi:predicted O-methyltransferase YrrM